MLQFDHSFVLQFAISPDDRRPACQDMRKIILRKIRSCAGTGNVPAFAGPGFYRKLFPSLDLHDPAGAGKGN
jgi:hypothetical protein